MLRAILAMSVALGSAAAHACPTPPQIELEIHLASVNAERRKAGRRALSLAPELSRVAQAHACDMARRGYFSHTSPDGRGMMDRARRAGVTGYCAMGENIAKGQPDVPSAMASWMRSPGHRRNILDAGYTAAGFGRGPGAHWVQVFAAEC